MKNSKKFLSAIMSAAVLTSSIAAIPASADYTNKENKTVILSENFDNLTIEKKYTTSEVALGDYIKYRNAPWATNIGQEYGISDGKFYLDSTNTTGDGEAFYAGHIYVAPASSVNIERGDVLHINFDTSLTYGSVATRVGLRLNESNPLKDFKFENIAGTEIKSDYCNNKASSYGDLGSNALVGFRSGAGATFGADLAGGSQENSGYLKNNVNVDIVINPYDEQQGNEQTIKTTFVYTTDSNEKVTVYNYSKFDADYTGAGDDENTKITSFEKLRFYFPTGNKAKFTLDNILVEKVNYTKEYYKATGVNNIIDCDFSNAVGFSKSSSNKSVYQIGSKDNAYFRDSWGATNIGAVENVVGPNGNNVYAFKQTISATDADGKAAKDGTNRLMFKNPNGSTAVKEGDIIRFSYDLKHDAADISGAESQYAGYFFSPVLNKPRYEWDYSKAEDYVNKYHCYYGEEADKTREDKYTIIGRYTDTSIQNNAESNSFLLNNSKGKTTHRATLLGRVGSQEITSNVWHHYDFIINTADKNEDGKQTIKVYVDKGTSNEISYYSTLDFNILNTAEDKITEFTTLEMTLFKKNCTVASGTIYSTNYKLDIITPSFGISGAAIADNDPTGGITLDAGKMTVECVLNVPGTDKKTTDSDYPTYNYTLYAAQYDGNTLVDVKLVKAEFTEDNCKATFDVDVKSGANKLKLFAFDENLTPLVVNETAAVNGSAASHSISYSLNTADLH